MLLPPRGHSIRVSIAILRSTSSFSHAGRSSAEKENARCSGPRPSCGPNPPSGSPAKKEKPAAASDAVRAKSVVTFDAGQAEGFFVEARRTIQVLHVEGRLENAGQRRHGKLPYRLETLFHQARYCERWRRNRSGSRLHVALDVFSQDVAFEVNRVAGLSVADVGVVIGIRNDGHFRDAMMRSEEHTSELQSLRHLVCRLLLEKKKK